MENVNDSSEEMSKQNNEHSTVILHSLVVTIRIGFHHVADVTLKRGYTRKMSHYSNYPMNTLFFL